MLIFLTKLSTVILLAVFLFKSFIGQKKKYWCLLVISFIQTLKMISKIVWLYLYSNNLYNGCSIFSGKEKSHIIKLLESCYKLGKNSCCNDGGSS